MKQLRLTACGAFLVMCSSGCYASRKVSLVENADSESRPEEIEVFRKMGGVYTVHFPRVEHDSLYGYSDKERERPVGFALDEIERARTQTYSSGQTALVAAGSVVAFLGGWLFLLWSSGGPSY